ncbi:MarR family winged helix-turn-helix transcriptional regulator [Caldimonas aquatica]
MSSTKRASSSRPSSSRASSVRASPSLRAVPMLDDHSIGHEARAASDDHMALKLWLRMLACTQQIETEIRRRLRARFGISLARFDYLAQLHRHPEGLRMNALSRYLMVTGGSITGLTDELEKEGLVVREAVPDDRRAFLLKLTPRGRQTFEAMAEEHESWVIEFFSDLRLADRKTLYELLGHLRAHMAARLLPEGGSRAAPGG